jgi:hypothetical protein
MKYQEDARTRELEHLKLALTTFALQLDAFEMLTKDILLEVGKPGTPASLVRERSWLREDQAIGDQ